MASCNKYQDIINTWSQLKVNIIYTIWKKQQHYCVWLVVGALIVKGKHPLKMAMMYPSLLKQHGAITTQLFIKLSFIRSNAILSESIGLLCHVRNEIMYVESWKSAGIILCMQPANERWRHIITSSLIGWEHTQNNPPFVYVLTHELLCVVLITKAWTIIKSTRLIWLTNHV